MREEAAAGHLPRLLRGLDGPSLAVVLVFFLTCCFVQAVIRLDYGPDEPFHLEYVHTLAAEHRLPRGTDTYEAHQPPLYYAAMAVLWAAAGVRERPLGVPPGPGAVAEMSGRARTARRVLRFANILLGCATLLVIARIVGLLGVVGWWRALILFLLAVCPMFPYLSSLVNNENGAIFFSAVVCLVLVLHVRGGRCSARQAFGIGLLLGLGMWIKLSTFFCLPLAAWALWRGGGTRERTIRLALLAAGFLALAVWWPLHNYQVTGDFFANYAVPPDQPTARAAALADPTLLLQWTQIALESSILPDWSRFVLRRHVSTVAAALSVMLVLTAFLFGLRDRGSRLRDQLRAMSITALLLLLLGIVWYALSTDWRSHAGGRHLLNGMPWVAVLLTVAIPRSADGGNPDFGPPARPVPRVAALLVLLLLLANVAWWEVARQHYLQIDRLGS